MTMEPNDIEDRALRLSPVGYLIFGMLGVGFYLVTRSEAILLDGVYSLISLVLALVALRVSKLVERPGNSRYHFGFAHFEPLINTVRVALILGVDAFALLSAIQALLSGGRDLNTGYALIYGVLSAVACLSMSAFQRRAARLSDSPILRVDARNWFVDGAISSGVGLTFLLAFFIERSSYSSLTPFLDPLLVVCLVIFTLPVTLRSLKENLPQLLHAAPAPEVQQEVRKRIESTLVSFDHQELSIRMIQVGRFFYVQLHVLLRVETETLEIARCDQVRRDLEKALENLHPRPLVDVMFTADDRDMLKP